MKKSIVLGIMFTLLVGIFVFHTPNEYYANEIFTHSESNLKKVIQKYFDMEKVQYTLEGDINTLNFDEVINPKDKELKDYLVKKNILMQNRRKANGNKIKIIDRKLTYNDIEYIDNNAIAKLNVTDVLQYSNLTDPTFISTNYEITLEKNKDNKYVITNIVSDDVIDLYIKGKVDIDEAIENDLKEIQKEKEINNSYSKDLANFGVSEDISTLSVNASLNRTNMYNYAQANWNKRPSNWGNFDGMGGDCTNFISQIIYAGGAPMDNTGSYQWYYYGYSDRAPSWTSVRFLYEYLIGNTGVGPQGYRASTNDMLYNMHRGDIIQIDFGSDGTYDHSTSIVNYQIGTLNNTTVAAHTNDVFNRPISDYPGTKRWIVLTGYMR